MPWTIPIRNSRMDDILTIEAGVALPMELPITEVDDWLRMRGRIIDVRSEDGRKALVRIVSVSLGEYIRYSPEREPRTQEITLIVDKVNLG